MLLIDMNGRLVINQNDSEDYGKSFRVRRIAKNFKEVYMLQLHGWGGADMLNLFDPPAASSPRRGETSPDRATIAEAAR